MKRRPNTTLGILLLWALVHVALFGCGPADTGTGEARTGEPAGTTEETTDARTVREATTAETSSVVEAAAAGVEEAEIREHLDHLTGVSPAPLDGREVTISERGSEGGRRAAAEYMVSSFEEMGIPARILEFRAEGLRGFNVEATLRGTEGGKHLWVTAHLDSVGNAGANDDASGLTSILLTAEALQRIEPRYTVHFVAFDLEELGLYGSIHYVENTVSDLREQEGDGAIVGALQSDMIAYEEGSFDAALGTCGDRSGPIEDAFSEASETLDSPIELQEVCLGRSDHQPFWDAGLPAAVLTDGAIYDGYPCYHETCDTVDKLNISYLRSIIELTSGATAQLADPPR
jgi:Peptidase family M28